jgi:hypothetical protein
MSYDVTLVNLTPHDIMIGNLNESGEFQLIKKISNNDGKIARLTTERLKRDSIDGIPVHAIQFLGVEGLPPPQNNVKYIVSMPVAQFVSDRNDLICPYSEKAFRKGNEILGVPAFVHYEPVKMKLLNEEKPAAIFKNFVNVSFQDVKIGVEEDGKFREVRAFPKSAKVAKVETAITGSETIGNIPVYSIKFLGLQDLPDEEEGVIYIVPMPVAQFSGRQDVYSADTDKPFRDKGNILGFPGLVRYISK